MTLLDTLNVKLIPINFECLVIKFPLFLQFDLN